MNLQNLLKQYDYEIPRELIALKPASPRDAARILVYGRKDRRMAEDRFLNLGKYLPERTVLVLNNTKVIPARLTLRKPSGGLVRVLYIGHDGKEVEVLADRPLTPLVPFTLRGRIGGKPPLKVRGGRGSYEFLVTRKQGSHYFFKPSFPMSKLFFILEQYGQVPLPPYLKNSPLSESARKEKYQTIFARTKGSVAAPTASLHFTKRLLAKLERAGVQIEYVTLHVNLGTFAPLTEEHLQEGRLHTEYFFIAKSCAVALNFAKREKRQIIAVGTTVARTLESASPARGRITKGEGATDLFIREDYKFKFVDGLITNFHVPQSSLLMLVSALVGRKKLLELYRYAIQKKYQFFSFGDGMLIY